MASSCRIFMLAVLPLLAGRGHAEPGLTGANFLQRNLGARSAGMGGAFVAVTNSIESIQYNPAALATLENKTLASTYLKGFADSNFGFLGYGHPLPLGTLAAAAVYFNAGTVDLNLSDGTTGRVTAEEDTAWTLSYGVETLKGLDLGATYRYARMTLAEAVHANTSQADVGALWHTPIKGLTAGAAYQYLGPDIKFEQVGDPSPKTWRYGIAYRLDNLDARKLDPSVDLQGFDVTMAADLVDVLYEKRSPRVGMEMGLEPFYVDRAAIRFGWVFDRDVESFSFGLGFRQGKFLLDYAFAPAKDLGSLQEITLSYQF